MYLSVCLSGLNTGHWGRCQLVIGSLQVKMTCWGAADLALSPCSSRDRWQGTLSLPMAYKKGDRGDRGEGNDPQNTPNPPKWNWQAHWSNCSQHYFLWQEILLSTNRRFNKRQEMRLGAMVKRLSVLCCRGYSTSWWSASLPCPFLLWLFVPLYFHSSLYILCFLNFLHISTTSLTQASLLHSIFPGTFHLGHFFLDHFSWMWQRNFSLLRNQQVFAPLPLLLLRLFLFCQYGGVMLILSQWSLLIWARVMKKQFMVIVFGFHRSGHVVKPELLPFWTWWCACWELLKSQEINKKEWCICLSLSITEDVLCGKCDCLVSHVHIWNLTPEL